MKHQLNGDSTLNVKQIIQQKVDKRLKEYRAERRSMKNEFKESSLNYQTLHQIYIDFNKNNYLILRTDIYDFMRGAHGNYANLYSCYDAKNKRYQSLQDILTTDAATLQKLIEGQYR